MLIDSIRNIYSYSIEEKKNRQTEKFSIFVFNFVSNSKKTQ